MNPKLRTLIFLLLMPLVGFADEVILLEGNYQMRNIYVANKILPTGVGFCVTNVVVNGEISTDEINSEAFEIDLSLFNLSAGDPVSVEIHYRDGCLPEVINPMALRPQATFKTEAIDLNNNVLTWSVSNETGSLPYRVQQFKWNKWVTIGEVEGVGKPGSHSYQFKVTFVSGKNRFRVIQKSGDGRTKVSPEVGFESMDTEVVLDYNKKEEMVNFSRATNYEVYDSYGRIIKRGFGEGFEVKDLEKGKTKIYYINYDNTFSEFRK